MSKGGTLFVKKRIGQLPYKDDIKVYHRTRVSRAVQFSYRGHKQNYIAFVGQISLVPHARTVAAKDFGQS